GAGNRARRLARRPRRRPHRLRHVELRPGAGRASRTAVRGAAAAERAPRSLRRREPRHVRARRRRRTRVRTDPHPPEAPRRHRRMVLSDRPHLREEPQMRDHYDVIIIGTGAGGGTLAHRLAPSGKRILLLERGGYLPREPENWDAKEVFGKGRYVTTE